MFDELGIDLDDLVYIDDLKTKKIGIILLVDHNEFDQREVQLFRSDLVEGVVDHHRDDRYCFEKAPMYIVNLDTGSNTSQIPKLFADSSLHCDQSFAKLMLFPIIFDTDNLGEGAGQIDIDAVAYLKKFCSYDTAILHAKLDELKFARDKNESVTNILKQDYKRYTGNWAMSSVTLCVEDWLVGDG